jgi:23S rRNA pseudouridine1911/1915/1917 synthase
MNLPVVGDALYGNPKLARGIADPQLRRLLEQLDRQFLHAWRLGFIHPQGAAELDFRAALPEELARIVAYLDEKYATLNAADPAVPDPGRSESV